MIACHVAGYDIVFYNVHVYLYELSIYLNWKGGAFGTLLLEATDLSKTTSLKGSLALFSILNGTDFTSGMQFLARNAPFLGTILQNRTRCSGGDHLDSTITI